jgi:hypothetical protein
MTTQYNVFLTSDPTDLPENQMQLVRNPSDPYFYPALNPNPDMSYRTESQIFGTKEGNGTILPFSGDGMAAAVSSKFFAETLMIGDRLRFSRNNSFYDGMNQLAVVADIVRDSVGVPTKIRLTDASAANTVDHSGFNGNMTIEIISQRAFNSAHHNQLTCELPFPMDIKSIELCAYSLQNVSTASPSMRPGVEDPTGNQDCHDYYSVHIDPYSLVPQLCPTTLG